MGRIAAVFGAQQLSPMMRLRLQSKPARWRSMALLLNALGSDLMGFHRGRFAQNVGPHDLVGWPGGTLSQRCQNGFDLCAIFRITNGAVIAGRDHRQGRGSCHATRPADVGVAMRKIVQFLGDPVQTVNKNFLHQSPDYLLDVVDRQPRNPHRRLRRTSAHPALLNALLSALQTRKNGSAARQKARDQLFLRTQHQHYFDYLWRDWVSKISRVQAASTANIRPTPRANSIQI